MRPGWCWSICSFRLTRGTQAGQAARFPPPLLSGAPLHRVLHRDRLAQPHVLQRIPRSDGGPVGAAALRLPAQRAVHAEAALAGRQRALLRLLLLLLHHDRRGGDRPVPAQPPAVLPLRLRGLVPVLRLLPDLHRPAGDRLPGLLSPGGWLCAAGGNSATGRNGRLSRRPFRRGSSSRS